MADHEIHSDIKKYETKKTLVDKIIDTRVNAHTHAYQTAIEQIRDEKGLINYKLLNDPKHLKSFTDAITDAYLDHAKKELKISADDFTDDEAEQELYQDMILQEYAGISKSQLKAEITRHKAKYTKDLHENIASQLTDSIRENLQPHTMSHFKKDENGNLEKEIKDAIIKYSGAEKYINQNLMEDSDYLKLLMMRHKYKSPIPLSELEGMNYFIKPKEDKSKKNYEQKGMDEIKEKSRSNYSKKEETPDDSYSNEKVSELEEKLVEDLYQQSQGKEDKEKIREDVRNHITQQKQAHAQKGIDISEEDILQDVLDAREEQRKKIEDAAKQAPQTTPSEDKQPEQKEEAPKTKEDNQEKNKNLEKELKEAEKYKKKLAKNILKENPDVDKNKLYAQIDQHVDAVKQSYIKNEREAPSAKEILQQELEKQQKEIKELKKQKKRSKNKTADESRRQQEEAMRREQERMAEEQTQQE